jgi:hypothetical protein
LNLETADWVTFVAGPGAALFGINSHHGDPPPIGEFPLGLFSFQVTGLAFGEATTVTLYPPPGLTFNTYWKYGREWLDNVATTYDDRFTDHWYEFLYDGTTGAEFINNSEGYTDRIILHFVDSQRGDSPSFTVNSGIPGGDHTRGLIDDPGGPVFRSLAKVVPRVENVVLNDGHAQRSKINSITVTFDSLVTIDPGAFELRRQGTNTPVGLVVALREENSRTVAVLTFRGHGIIGGSLFEGRYTLLIHGDKIRGTAGQSLDGDGDGIEGGNRREEFFRRFGDSDGDGDVDATDRRQFLTTLGSRAGGPDYLWYFDFNDDGRVALIDLLAVTIASLGPFR